MTAEQLSEESIMSIELAKDILYIYVKYWKGKHKENEKTLFEAIGELVRCQSIALMSGRRYATKYYEAFYDKYNDMIADLALEIVHEARDLE
jgi:hypothetical protein